MIEFGENNDCDIVRGKITGVTNEGRFYKLAAEHLLHTESKNRVHWLNEESLWFYWYFTANLYKARFIKDNRIRFPSNFRNEDPFFLCRCFLAAKNISLYSDIVYYYRVGDEQKNKSPTLSFLTGWSMGYYYLYQLIQNQYKQAQYFMVHFPSLLKHSKNIAKYLPKEQAFNLLKYIKLIFKNVNIKYYEKPTSQPWLRKKNFHKNYIEYIFILKRKSLEKIYNYLLEI
jgi:hypothetical protein